MAGWFRPRRRPIYVAVSAAAPSVPSVAPAILVEHLTKRFRETVVAVDDISFAVPRGATAALLGGNGAGKTTTLSMLLGLLLPTEGRIRILG